MGYSGERGLLRLAFHPRFAANGRFYVNYINRHGDMRVERYEAAPAVDTANPTSACLMLFVARPYPNHNGGDVLFGPTGCSASTRTGTVSVWARCSVSCSGST